MFQLKVLVADSNRPSLSLYTDILSKMGFHVDNATDGNSAWEVFCRGSYHAVLVDFRLPGINGEELFSRIKKIAPDVDVVLLTGNSSIEKIMKLVDKGVTDYLIKPANPVRIREMFEKIATKQKLFYDGSTLADELGELPDLGDDLPLPSAESLADTPPEIFPEAFGNEPESSGDSEQSENPSFLSEEVRRLEALVHELASERDMLRSESDRLRAEHNLGQNEYMELVSRVDSLESQNIELSHREKRLSEDLASLEKQLDSSSREVADIASSRSRLKEALDRERAGNKRLTNRIEELTAAVEAEREKTISSTDAGNILTSLRDEISALKASATAKEEAVTYLKRKLKARNEKYKVLKEAAKELQNENSNIESLSRDSQTKLKELKRTLEARAGRIEQLEEQLNRGKIRIKALSSELDERDNEILKVRTEALQSGEEVVLNTELRYKRIVDGLNNDVETLREELQEKEEQLAQSRNTMYELKEQMAVHSEEFSAEKSSLLKELSDLREVLTEREQFVRETKVEREKQFSAELARKEAEIEEARKSSQAEAGRLEEELEALRESQSSRSLQDELQSEWMELGEALVLLDEELKEKEAECKDLKEEFSRKERNYETTIANQKRKYLELEAKIFEQIKESSSDEPEPVKGGGLSSISLQNELEGIPCASVLLSTDGRTVDFNDEFQASFGIDSTRRTSSSSLFEVNAAKYIQPLFLRLVQGEDTTVERPLYIRSGDSDPKPYWGVATAVSQDGEESCSIDLYDLSSSPELFSKADFTDARIAFDTNDSICTVSSKMTEALFSVRIVVEILLKKFKSDVELHSMITDVMEELNGLLKLIETI